jgi:hypothetical protein
LNDAFLGVGTPSIAGIDLIANPPTVTYEDTSNDLNK